MEKILEGSKSAAGPAFADWCYEYALWHKAEYPSSYPRVRQILQSHLLPVFGFIHIGMIGRKEVEAYKQGRIAAGAATGTVIKELRTLQAVINKAVEWDIIPINKAKGVKPPKDLNSTPPQWYSAEELQQIYATESQVQKCATTYNNELHQKYRWVWQLLANTGLRRSEAMALEWKNIGQQEIRVVSTEQDRTKSAKWRLIPVSNGAVEALDALKGEKHVLPRVTKPSLSRAFSRTLERAKLAGSIHCLRHTYCSHLVMAGVPLRTVQVLAGHASYTTTERYAHLAPGHLQESVKGLKL